MTIQYNDCYSAAPKSLTPFNSFDSFVQLSNQMTKNRPLLTVRILLFRLFNQKTKMALAASKLIEKTNDSNKEYHESKIVAERGTCTNK